MESEHPPLISVIIPVYNEAVGIRALLTSVSAELDNAGCRHELIVIDDGSTDHTWQTLSEAAGPVPQLRGFRLSRNFGKELALCAGLERARGDAVIVMDGDGQHPPSLVPAMIEMWRSSGVDIVRAVKPPRGGEPLGEKVGAFLFYLILHKLSPFDLRGASDFKLMNRKA